MYFQQDYNMYAEKEHLLFYNNSFKYLTVKIQTIQETKKRWTIYFPISDIWRQQKNIINLSIRKGMCILSRKQG